MVATPQRSAERSVVESATTAALDRIRSHPFIQRAHGGQLSQGQAHRWIMCAGRESRSFPAILENMVTRSTNSKIREILQENLDDEYGGGDPNDAHFQHYLHLLDQLSIQRQEFEAYDECAGIRLALTLAYNVSSQENEAIALGYMLVNEGMTPITYEAARAILTKYHPELRTTFFDLHIAVDEKHVEELYKAIAELPPQATADLLFAVNIGERGMAVLLDEALGVFDHVLATN